MSVINAENISKSAHFTDNSHYFQVFEIFQQSLNKDFVKVKDEFGKCRSEQDRLLLLEKYFSWVEIPEIYFKRLSKSSELSESFRVTGNSAYARQAISESLRCYNLSLLFAPEGSMGEALALANRSALFLLMKEYQYGLRDCEAALALHAVGKVTFSKEIEEKLFKRKHRLEKLVESDVEFFQDVKGQGEKFFKGMEEKMKESGRNEVAVKGAAHFVKIQSDDVKGRKIVNGGTEILKAGTGILFDPGYTLLLDKQTNWDTEHCSTCGDVILGGLTTPLDVFCSFCSQNCIKEWTRDFKNFSLILPYFHSTEELHDLLLISKILTKTGQEKLEELQRDPHFLDDNDSTSRVGSSRSKTSYDYSDYAAVYNLIAHYDPPELTPSTLRSYFRAIFLGNLLLKLKLFRDSENSFKSFLISLIHRHMNNLQYNVITLCEWRSVEGPISNYFWGERARGKCLEICTSAYATGVFPLIALVNHSCDPNCVFIKNSRMPWGLLMSTRVIQVGEEFCISYKAPWTRMGWDGRIKYLKENYKFDCGCGPCGRELSVADVRKRSDQGRGEKEELIDHCIGKGEYLLRKRRLVEAFELFTEAANLLDGVDWDQDIFQMCQDLIRRCLVELSMA